jgi:hypothetical protein
MFSWCCKLQRAGVVLGGDEHALLQIAAVFLMAMRIASLFAFADGMFCK